MTSSFAPNDVISTEIEEDFHQLAWGNAQTISILFLAPAITRFPPKVRWAESRSNAYTYTVLRSRSSQNISTVLLTSDHKGNDFPYGYWCSWHRRWRVLVDRWCHPCPNEDNKINKRRHRASSQHHITNTLTTQLDSFTFLFHCSSQKQLISRLAHKSHLTASTHPRRQSCFHWSFQQRQKIRST